METGSTIERLNEGGKGRRGWGDRGGKIESEDKVKGC